MTAWPQALSGFALTAVCIGITEEIIFRGVIFYILQKQSAPMCILFSSLAHAGYKTLLFLSPFAMQQVDFAQVFTYTFLAGLLLGSMRWYAASAASPIIAHASWDAMVYGDSPAAPWWVW
ncbi:MAG TPA: CPBP family intramembrane glutamic endopeptidase [Phnomibacter sp.]|nr:CPBP family intramembrane glutamic endopeptidase [Phnomibacter sp.]